MLPDLTSLALFLRVVQLGSISKAATQSNMVLSAASRRIVLMEERLGVKLLTRTANGVTLTAAGEALAFHAKQLLSQVDRLHVDLSDYAEGGRGVVRICAAASALTGYLPRDLASFAAHNPQITVELLERRSPDSIAAIRDGRADIGVVLTSDPPTTQLKFYRYKTEELVAVLPQSHPFKASPTEFHRLLDYDIVGLEGNTPLMALLESAARAAGKPFRLRVQVWSFDVVCRLIEANLGIGVLPKQAAKIYCRDLKLRLLPLSDRWATRQIYLCVRDEPLPSPAQRMMDHLLGLQVKAS